MMSSASLDLPSIARRSSRASARRVLSDRDGKPARSRCRPRAARHGEQGRLLKNAHWLASVTTAAIYLKALYETQIKRATRYRSARTFVLAVIRVVLDRNDTTNRPHGSFCLSTPIIKRKMGGSFPSRPPEWNGYILRTTKASSLSDLAERFF